MIAIGVAVFSVSLAAQWPRMQDPTSPPVPRDAQGRVNMTAPTPRHADGKPDLSGVWMRANSGPPRGGGAGAQQGTGGGGAGGRQGAGGATAAPAAGEGQPGFGPVRGGVQLEPPTEAFPFDPKGPPVATFFEAGANIPGGLPYTPWAAELRKQRLALNARDNPDAMCFPMGFLQFHQQPQPRKIYLDGRKLPPQGEPQPWWYGYSVGRWEGDTLVVETNNLRGAEDSPYDGWMDVNGSPYSNQAKITERFRRPTFGQLQIDLTLDDPKSYTRPWTVRVDQRYLPDEEMIEFICNENQQFRRKIKID